MSTATLMTHTHALREHSDLSHTHSHTTIRPLLPLTPNLPHQHTRGTSLPPQLLLPSCCCPCTLSSCSTDRSLQCCCHSRTMP
jgi:hypothetical protein